MVNIPDSISVPGSICIFLLKFSILKTCLCLMSGGLPLMDQDDPSNLGFLAADEDEVADEDEAMMKEGLLTFNNEHPL